MAFNLRSSGPFKMMGSSPVKQKTETGNVTPNNKKLLKSERDGVMVYEGKSNTEIQNDLEDRIGFINEDIFNDGKSTPQQKIDIAILRGKLRKAKKAAAKTDDGNVLPTKRQPGDDLTTSKEEKLAAELKVKELIANYETEMEKNITARWDVDMKSDSWLAKNVRPLVLMFLVVCTVIMIFIDAGAIKFNVEEKWTELLQMVLITVIGAYFGGRSFEKIKNK